MSYRRIGPEEAKAIIDAHPGCTILDVRRPDEFVLGHIAGAVNVPLDNILMGNLPACLDDKDALYLIYCRSGVRSVTAADLLEAYGYTNLIEFGGILFWPYGLER